MVRRRKNPAFTLIELVLVMIVLSIALAVTTPSLRGWSRGQQVRDAADQFVAVTHRARALAAAEARVYRLNVDANAGSYNLTYQDGDAFVSPGATWGKTFNVPTGVRLTFNKTAVATNTATVTNTTTIQATPSTALDFSPTGASEPATITFTGDTGAIVTVQSTSPAEGFSVVPAGGRS